LIANHGFEPLNWVGLAWMVAAITLSLWAGRRTVSFA